MDEEIQKIIDQQIEILPKEVRQAIISIDYKTKLQEITKRQRLLIDQAAKLEMETTLVMIGLEPLADYTENLQRELNIPIVRAKEIAIDVNENIFKPIRGSLQAMNEAAEETEKSGQNPLEAKNGEALPRFTNSNETNLNRDQILNEIENPSTIEGGARAIDFAKETPPKEELADVSGEEKMIKAEAFVSRAEESFKKASISNKAGAEEILNKAKEARDKIKEQLTAEKINQKKKEAETPEKITGIEIKPKNDSVLEVITKVPQEIEIIPDQTVAEISPDILKAKMTGPTIVSQQIINAKPEIKLPEVEKKRPYDGVDPYKEVIN